MGSASILIFGLSIIYVGYFLSVAIVTVEDIQKDRTRTAFEWLGFRYKFEFEVLDHPVMLGEYYEYPVRNRYRYLYWFNWKIKKS